MRQAFILCYSIHPVSITSKACKAIVPLNSIYIIYLLLYASPMQILLTCCSIALDSSIALDTYNVPVKYDGMEDDVEWMLNGETKIMDEFESLLTSVFHWSLYSLLAEVCLHLANRLEVECGKQRDL